MYVYVQLGFSRDRVGFVIMSGAAVYWKQFIGSSLAHLVSFARLVTFLVYYVVGTQLTHMLRGMSSKALYLFCGIFGGFVFPGELSRD